MKKYLKYTFAILIGAFILTSCEDKSDTYQAPTAPASGTLKAVAQARGLQIGNILSYDDISNQQKSDLIKNEFDNVSFVKELTHGSIVQDDGSLNFSKADAMLSWAKNNGIGVNGFTLIWHQSQNANYLKSVAAPPPTEFYGPNLVQNPTLDDNLDGYAQLNPSPTGGCGPRIDQGAGRNGTNGLYVDGTCSAISADDYWRLQIRAMLNSKMEKDGLYRVEFWIKAGASGTVQVETREASGADAQYKTFDVTPAWTKVTLEFTAIGTENAFCFDLNNANRTEYWIDDVSVYQVMNTPPNIVQNSTFDENIDGYAQLNPSPGGSCGPRIDQGDGRNDTKGLYVDGSCSGISGDDYWRMQVRGMLYTKMQANVDYVIEFWIKAGASGTVQLETREASGSDAQYKTFDVTPAWTKVTLMFTAKGTEDAFCFDLNNANRTEYWIDDVSVKQYVDPNPGGISEESIAMIDNAMQTWITACVDHFKSDIHTWDVVNEPMADGNSGVRTSSNTAAGTATDVFFWSDILGRDYALKAFKYAEAADPSALLFINDYGLDTNTAKIDSLIAFVAELKEKGAKVDGIGVQMHVNIATAKTGVDYMFKKLAATGLKIRISALDVLVNRLGPNGASSTAFVMTPQVLSYQAATYHDVITSYMENVPKEQQYGITIWGVNDSSSWEYNNGTDFPLPWNDDLTRKPAYNAVYNAMQ